MYKQEKIKPYSSSSSKKSEQVKDMFNNIAKTYDKLNHRLSFDIDKLWRREAIKRLSTYMPKNILDVATGTGDFALKAAKQFHPDNVVGIDIAEKMLQIARKKAEKQKLNHIISFKYDDCLNLSFNDKQFDAVISAFGIRNFENLELGLKEMYRVLQDGGHLCILELTSPVKFPMKQLYSFYSNSFLPIYGRLVSKDKHAYNYLTATIEAFPQGETMLQIFEKIGFHEATFKRLTGGICTLYIATK